MALAHHGELTTEAYLSQPTFTKANVSMVPINMGADRRNVEFIVFTLFTVTGGRVLLESPAARHENN